MAAPITFSAQVGGQKLSFESTFGLFSPKELDEGTRLLMEQLKVAPDANVLDLGCGYGPIGVYAAKLAPEGEVHLVDKDFMAVEYTQKNIERNTVTNAKAYLSDGFSHVPSDQKFDLIVSNLPAKVGNQLLRQFFEDSKERLNSDGKLIVVTISGLRDYVKRNFDEVFGNYEKLKQGKSYTVAQAVKHA